MKIWEVSINNTILGWVNAITQEEAFLIARSRWNGSEHQCLVVSVYSPFLDFWKNDCTS